MRLANEAWNEVDTTTIHNCWNKANIMPSNLLLSRPAILPTLPISALVHTTEAQANNNPVSEEERLVTEALDVLEATGALQRSN